MRNKDMEAHVLTSNETERQNVVHLFLETNENR